MRIVMPLFDFSKESPEEYVFSGGKYALRKFDAADEVPDIELFSGQDIGVMEFGAKPVITPT